jgi:hypothetical protein
MGFGSESGDGDESGDEIGGEDDMTGDGGVGMAAGEEVCWTVCWGGVVANIWETCPENP